MTKLTLGLRLLVNYSNKNTNALFTHLVMGTQRLVSGNICSVGLKWSEISNLIAVKARDFFGQTSRWSFVTRGLIVAIAFEGTNISLRVQNKVSL